ncbi:YcdB/YcdC domain-containing protein [Brevibacillus laterosporus]|uniref:YcdB/YcdC domain-containing protein n=1 Tax=Brevibacillus laterosporus TaxID=1465 RepID=UPI002651A023|nr:YcdB/YcdC domain-containing protein [Brevibacillus laterosporus]MDN9009971.1 peptidase [Brevibacillus laterosporus]MDO0940647.1 peptidase [Brevibacillus laterosporus]
MDVEKEFRESVQTVSRNASKDVRFTVDLEKRIKEKASKDVRKRHRRLYAVATAVACLALAITVWKLTPSGLQEILKQSATALTEKKTNAIIEKALQSLQKAIPDLSSYQLDIKETADNRIKVQLRAKDGKLAKVAINRETGSVEVFKWFNRDTTEQIPSEKIAKEKADLFLKSLLGNHSEEYQQVAISEIKRPKSGYLELDVKGMNVSYQQMKNGEPVPFAKLSVWVDGSGRVVSYGELNKSEQAMLIKLKEAIPELNTEATLTNKEVESSGYHFSLANADKEGNSLMISTEGKGDLLTNYNLETPRKQGVEWAEKSLATKKANRFLQHMLGDDFSNYQETGTTGRASYMRFYNGLPVLEDNLTVVVDKGGRIIYYSRATGLYDLASLPDRSKAISPKKAEEALTQNMKLRYIERSVVKRDPETHQVIEERPLLDYTPAVSHLQMGKIRSLNWYIDAGTGKVEYGLGNNGIDYDRRTTHEPIRLKASKPPMIKTKEEAARLLTDHFGVKVTGLPFSEREGESRFGAKQHVFQWQTKNEKRLEVVVNAKTGQVEEINIPRVDGKITVSQQDALKEAVAALEKYVDPGVTEVQISRILEPQEANPVNSGDWHFSFFKSQDGVPVIEQYPDQAYEVSVDPSTGKVNGFENLTQWKGNIVLPDKSQAVPVKEAVQEYLKVMPLQLAYTLKGVDREKLSEPKLIYVSLSAKENADKHIYLNAITGKVEVQ